MGNKNFFGVGSGFTVDTSKKVTVVTQWLTSDNSASGTLSEIKRFYVQDGNVIENAYTKTEGLGSYNSITQETCDSQKKFFEETNSFGSHGGMKNMGEAMARGMTLVMSLWDDHYAHMLWLDSDYPTDKSATEPGVARGPCATSSGDPKDVES